MVRCCCVPGCKNESYVGSPVSLHRFPKDENIKLKWEEALSRKLTKTSAVCSEHFKFDDFKPGYMKSWLKPEAVPSINLKHMPYKEAVLILSNKIQSHESVTDEVEDESSTTTIWLQQMHHSLIKAEEEPAPKSIWLQESVPEVEKEPTTTWLQQSVTNEVEKELGSKTARLQESVTEELEEEPTPKTIHLQQRVIRHNRVSTAASPIENKLRYNIKLLKQCLKRRNKTIHNLRCFLKIIKKNCDNYSKLKQMFTDFKNNKYLIQSKTYNK